MQIAKRFTLPAQNIRLFLSGPAGMQLRRVTLRHRHPYRWSNPLVTLGLEEPVEYAPALARGFRKIHPGHAGLAEPHLGLLAADHVPGNLAEVRLVADQGDYI